MSAVRHTRCRLLLAACSLLAAGVMGGALAEAAPYVSCPGGYIAHNLADCPPVPQHPVGGPRAGGGGGGGVGGSGVLGNLLGHLGLGGLF